MAVAKKQSNERPRELRRRVLIQARIRSGAQWSDACILNISSRGLMIQSHRAGLEGSTVELHRGDHVIIARVVWREGGRAGLRCDDRLPVEQILSLSQSGSLRLVASDGAFIDRRRRPRASKTDARIQGRAIEFAGTALLLVMFAIGLAAMAQHALVRPFARVEAALSGQ